METVSSHRGHIEIFVVYDAGQRRRRSDFNGFFSNVINDIDSHITGKPIFFNEEKALHYMRFVEASYCILRVYVLESAIEAHFDELRVKKDSILRKQIHGCYPSYAKGEEYLLNPAFDENLLALVATNREDFL